MEPLKQLKFHEAMVITDNSFTELYQKSKYVKSDDYLQGMQDLRNKILNEMLRVE